jgi:hypothetical protein
MPFQLFAAAAFSADKLCQLLDITMQPGHMLCTVVVLWLGNLETHLVTQGFSNSSDWLVMFLGLAEALAHLAANLGSAVEGLA